MDQTSSMTIGRLAQASGVGVETVRYYQRLKLLDEPTRAYGSIRRYGGDTLERIRFIKRAQGLGFTLSEIKTLFLLDAKRDRHRAHRLAQSKISEIEQRLKDMSAMRSSLRQLVSSCEAGDAQLPCPAWRLSKAAIPAMNKTQPHATAAVAPESREHPIDWARIESARSHDVSVNTGAKPPPGVRKFVVCPWYRRAATILTIPA